MSPSSLDEEQEMRRRTLDMFSMDMPAVAHFLNRFFFWHGMLANDAQVSCHNSAEAFIVWLMGGKVPTHVDPRFVEQLETLLGSEGGLAKKMSGTSYEGKTKPRKAKRGNDV
jgi:hypothetical protein